jgi:hypothetical protein
MQIRNLGLKLFALIVAIGLGVYVRGEKNAATIVIVAPVEIRNIPADQMLVWPSSPRVQLSIRGPSYLVKDVAADNPTVRLSVPPGTNSRYRVPIHAHDIEVPVGVEVVGIEPTEIELVLDKKAKKTVSVAAPLLGKLAKDYELAALTLEPATVMLSGPESELSRINDLRTDPVDLNGLTADTTVDVQLRTPGSFVQLGVDRVKARLTVRLQQRTRLFRDQRILVRGVGFEKFMLKPEKVEVKVQGARSVIEELSEKDFFAYVELPSPVKGGEVLMVKIDGVASAESIPAQVTVSERRTRR